MMSADPELIPHHGAPDHPLESFFAPRSPPRDLARSSWDEHMPECDIRRVAASLDMGSIPRIDLLPDSQATGGGLRSVKSRWCQYG